MNSFMEREFAKVTGGGRQELTAQIAADKEYLIGRGYREGDFTFILSRFVPPHVAAMALRRAVSFHQAREIEKGEGI